MTTMNGAVQTALSGTEARASAPSGRVLLVRKLAIAAIGCVLLATSGLSFYKSRHMREPVVLGPGVTAVKHLSDYFPDLKGSINDANIYILEGKQPGATVFVIGGSHPEEPAGRLTPWILVENAEMESGRLIVVLSANRSATTATRPSGAYPPAYEIPTPFGQRVFRMGDRWSNPLDQWPDPEVYIHYPSGQYLAYMDVRNLNRTWPGRPNGTLTERTTYAFMEMIRKEKVDVVIDLHEAELQYPVISTIVTHQRGQDLASMASMMLTDFEGFKIGCEFSPKNLHGLSHREIGDFSPAVSLLFETAEPFLDATRGRTTVEQLLTGKDDFVVKAGQHGLLYEKIDENGWPIAVRVGRHNSSILQVLDTWTEDNPGKPVKAVGVPRYADLLQRGVGYYLRDPSKTAANRLAYE